MNYGKFPLSIPKNQALLSGDELFGDSKGKKKRKRLWVSICTPSYGKRGRALHTREMVLQGLDILIDSSLGVNAKIRQFTFERVSLYDPRC